MRLALSKKSLDRPSSRCDEEGFSSDAVVVCNLSLALNLANPVLSESVARMLGVVPIVTADTVGSLNIAAVPQVVLDRFLCSSMRFLAHD